MESAVGGIPERTPQEMDGFLFLESISHGLNTSKKVNSDKDTLWMLNPPKRELRKLNCIPWSDLQQVCNTSIQHARSPQFPRHKKTCKPCPKKVPLRNMLV